MISKGWGGKWLRYGENMRGEDEFLDSSVNFSFEGGRRRREGKDEFAENDIE